MRYAFNRTGVENIFYEILRNDDFFVQPHMYYEQDDLFYIADSDLETFKSYFNRPYDTFEKYVRWIKILPFDLYAKLYGFDMDEEHPDAWWYAHQIFKGQVRAHSRFINEDVLHHIYS